MALPSITPRIKTLFLQSMWQQNLHMNLFGAFWRPSPARENCINRKRAGASKITGLDLASRLGRLRNEASRGLWKAVRAKLSRPYACVRFNGRFGPPTCALTHRSCEGLRGEEFRCMAPHIEWVLGAGGQRTRRRFLGPGRYSSSGSQL